MTIKQDNSRLQILSDIEENLKKNPNNSLYIWGTAKTARTVTDFCRANSTLTISGYIVDDAYYRDELYMGCKVYKASEWKKTAVCGDYVIMGFTDEKRAETVCSELPAGISGVYFYFPYSTNEDGSCPGYEDYLENKQRLEAVYEKLADDHSKKTLEAFINACISGEIEELNALRTEGQYFNILTKEIQPESFIDCGAYTGDTIEEALEFYGDSLKRIVAFEPDEKNLEQLERRLQKHEIPDGCLKMFAVGTWSSEQVLHFSSSDSSSGIRENGDIEIKVDALDHVLASEPSVDFVKMDVEGSEKESLLGAADTIRKFHPALAICAYHRFEDLYVLPDLIEKLTGNGVYEYFFRYHGPDLRELVFYAVPVK